MTCDLGCPCAGVLTPLFLNVPSSLIVYSIHRFLVYLILYTIVLIILLSDSQTIMLLSFSTFRLAPQESCVQRMQVGQTSPRLSNRGERTKVWN